MAQLGAEGVGDCEACAAPSGCVGCLACFVRSHMQQPLFPTSVDGREDEVCGWWTRVEMGAHGRCVSHYVKLFQLSR